MLGLAGCASVKPLPAPSAPAFSIAGRMLAVQGERRVTTHLRWSHGLHTRILLTTPVGQTLAQIETDADGAQITTMNGRSYRADSISDLASRGLGWPLPLDLLPWWIGGEPAPGDSTPLTSGDGFTQAGWEVRLGQRDETGHLLRLDARRDSAPDFAITLLIDRWLDTP